MGEGRGWSSRTAVECDEAPECLIRVPGTHNMLSCSCMEVVVIGVSAKGN